MSLLVLQIKIILILGSNGILTSMGVTNCCKKLHDQYTNNKYLFSMECHAHCL